MKVGITHGDLNGVNYEILLKIFEDERIAELCTPVIYGSPRVAAWYKKTLDLPGVQFNVIEDIADVKEGEVNMINTMGATEPNIVPGVSTQEAGEAARVALEMAVKDLREGNIDVLVTAPINKNNIQSKNFDFPGHTEYLEKELAEEGSDKALMILASPHLRVAVATGHLPLKEVPSAITEELILEKLRIFNHSLTMDFTLPNPRIAVLALNPHSGDKGLLGEEEQKILAPAIAKAQEEGILAFGPFPADGFFGSGNFRHFDGVLAMYHDQGLVPFKTIAMDSGVNFTAGLPYVRTSPDHGTGYDIAGKNEASAESMREAIYMAIDIYRHRQRNKEVRSNPLKKHYFTTPKARD